jgi:5,10-methylenetetrahydromethanopterin reductase
MTDRQISIAFQTDQSPERYISLARLVDLYPFDALSVYCDIPYHPGFGPLLLMAPHLRRMRVGPAGVSPARVAPVDMAAEIALLDAAAPGGAYLGLVRGAWLRDYGVSEPSRPIQAIRETIEIVRYMLAGRQGGYRGQVYQLADHVTAPYPLPARPIPILIGTWGAALCAVAGELADEVKVGGSANPAMVSLIQSDIARGEDRAGRPRGAVRVVMGAVTVVDEDARRARQAAREAVALYLPVVASLDRTLSVEPDRLERIRRAVEQGDRAAAARLISDDLLRLFALAGSPADIIAHCEALFDAGAGRIEFGTPHGLVQEAGIRLLGEQVLPALRG